MNFKKYIQISTIPLIIFSLALIILGIAVWSKNPYTGVLYLIIGVVQFLGAVFVYPRVAKAQDMTDVGNRSVQQNWIILSISIAGVALFLAPFFRTGPMVLPYVVFVICWIALFLSAFNIYFAVKKTGARMVV